MTDSIQRDQHTNSEEEHEAQAPASEFMGQKEPRRYWIGRTGAVVSNMPAGRWKLGPFTDEEDAAAAARRIALDAAGDWHHYGGFLVCESCSREDARRIVAALNFVEGLPQDFIERAPFKRLMPSHNWQEG